MSKQTEQSCYSLDKNFTNIFRENQIEKIKNKSFKTMWKLLHTRQLSKIAHYDNIKRHNLKMIGQYSTCNVNDIIIFQKCNKLKKDDAIWQLPKRAQFVIVTSGRKMM